MAWAPHNNRTTPLPPNWQTLRKATLVRDGHACVQCGSTHRLEVDHAGQPWQHDNLRTLCHTCHTQHTAQQAATNRWQHKEQRPPEPHPGTVKP